MQAPLEAAPSAVCSKGHGKGRAKPQGELEITRPGTAGSAAYPATALQRTAAKAVPGLNPIPWDTTDKEATSTGSQGSATPLLPGASTARDLQLGMEAPPRRHLLGSLIALQACCHTLGTQRDELQLPEAESNSQGQKGRCS